ncbi:Oxalate-binding protein [bioreactor metagenome]|uniref:Oxalate-binding protein n=1 Tax=bioreactor metagenome TaxID=1076179 RepID=A0A644SVN2_9ZZZZ|nr:cupin domain-containing protein [Negativicutes bacterium]
MIKRAGTITEDIRPNMLGGKGEVKILHLLEGDEFQGKGRLFAHNIIKPGCSIGGHQHKGDIEAYYVLKGEATYYDNGEKTTLKPGDLTFTDNQQSHGIENEGTEDVEVIALILFA